MSVCDNSGEDQPSRGVVHTAGGEVVGSVQCLFFLEFRCANHSWPNVYCSLGKFNPVLGSEMVVFFPPVKSQMFLLHKNHF